ncbi:hypothetical protein SLS58_003403 [Diplodia intermedia]|uniref:Uncharacterized protein n=1 Tax=Diplodia intermedia TaxID=856260 RepID=A0ABR3TVY2_9PEZI
MAIESIGWLLKAAAGNRAEESLAAGVLPHVSLELVYPLEPPRPASRMVALEGLGDLVLPLASIDLRLLCRIVHWTDGVGDRAGSCGKDFWDRKQEVHGVLETLFISRQSVSRHWYSSTSHVVHWWIRRGGAILQLIAVLGPQEGSVWRLGYVVPLIVYVGAKVGRIMGSRSIGFSK